MSRQSGGEVKKVVRFPRVSGDEPYIAGRLLDYSKFSPRERG